MRTSLSLIAGVALLASATDALPSEPRDLISQARILASVQGDSVWPGYSAAPFGVLLVGPETERLYCHDGTPTGFQRHGFDEVMNCNVAERATTFPNNLLASFPAVDGVPTIVIGTPEATGLTPDAWLLTLLHEHFHQMQFAWPMYYSGIEALNLSDGDESGSWMLDYPFPYQRDETAVAFKVMADRLLDALDARQRQFTVRLIRYWQARQAAKETVSTADWRYLEVQLWQEGVARWTEAAIAGKSSDFAQAARVAGQRMLRGLEHFDLKSSERAAVYPIGAAEATLLESGGPGWRDAYWQEPFSLGPQLGTLLIDETLAAASDMATHDDGRASIQDLYAAYLGLARQGWRVDLIAVSQPAGTSHPLPIISLRSPATGPATWIIAGIHGEEPAGPNAIAQAIDALAALGNKRSIVLLPLANPHGYVRNWRYLNTARWSEGVEVQSVGDSSHLLADPEDPERPRAPSAANAEADAITRYILETMIDYPPLVSIDLHEDNLIDAGYVYSQGVSGVEDGLALAAIRVLRDNDIPIQMNGQTRFEERIVGGIIGPVVDSSIDEFMSAAHVIVSDSVVAGPAARTVLVFETPAADMALDRRVAAHRALLQNLSGMHPRVDLQ